jgi:hypothetical protein
MIIYSFKRWFILGKAVKGWFHQKEQRKRTITALENCSRRLEGIG